MSLWVDKYRPRTLAELDYHKGIAKRLEALAASGDFPHLLVYGPSGAGKKTRILATLHELFGSSVEKIKIDVRTFQTSSNRKLEFNVVSSPHHIEITPSDMGNNDRVVIQDLLKDIAQTEQLDYANGHRFKVVIINEADSLSRDAQAALRRTMEKYSSNIRLILVANTTSNILPPIKSRTLLIRIAAPLPEDIKKLFFKVAKRERINLSSSETELNLLFDKIVEASGRNLRKGLLMFESLYMQSDELSSKTPIVKADWEEVISRIGKGMLAERSVNKLIQIRGTYYELLSHCIPAKVILKTLVFELLANSKPNVKPQLIELAADFDDRLSLGSKDIFHLEGFTAKAMVALEKATAAH